MSIIGDLVKYYREERGMSQADLSEKDCSRESIVKIETGKNVPKIETIALLSEKLNVNLFGAISAVYAHNDLRTHLLCREGDEALNSEDMDKLERWLVEIDGKGDFSKGEPKQLVFYAKALIEFNKGNYEGAKENLLKGIQIRHQEFPEKLDENARFNNKEYAMIMAYAVTLERCNEKKAGADILRFEKNHIEKLLSMKDFFDDTTKGFLCNMMSSCLYNRYCIEPELSIELYNEIDAAIDNQKESKRVFNLPDLLFCKAALLANMGELKEARDTYNTALVFGNFYYGTEKTKELAQNIINARSDFSIFGE